MDDPPEVAQSVLALHATDPTSVYLQVRARSPTTTVHGVDEALYTDRTLVRMMGMRRTLFVAPTSTAPVIQHGAMDRVAGEQHRRLVRQLIDADLVAGDVDRWLVDVGDATVRALAELGGEASTEQLIAAEPRLRTSMVLSPGKPWETRTTIASRLAVLLGCQGRIVRGRPGGGWASRRYRWALPQVWFGAAPPVLEPAVARADLVRRWLSVFGPAPESDLKWWTGWPLTRLRAALADVDTVEVEVDDVSMLVLAADLGPTDAPPVSAALLPALDPTVMGWSERSWFLGEHAPRLFDRFGNAGPTVWWDGHVVGGWGQTAAGEVRVVLFENLGATGRAAVEAETERLQGWLGELRCTPTFRTPTELALTARTGRE